MRRILIGLAVAAALVLAPASAQAAPDEVYVSEPFASNPDVGAVIKVDTAGNQSLLAQQGNLALAQVNQVAFEPPDNLLVAVGDGKIVRVNKNTGAQSILAQGGLLNAPFGVAVGPTGDAFVTDNNQVFKITPAGDVSLFEDDPLLGTTKGLTVAPNGDVFVVSTTAPGLIKISNGTASAFSTSLAYNNPQSVARDSSGNFYVANRNNANILTTGPAGGAPTEYIPASNPTIDEPVAVAIDRLNNLLVADLDVTADNNPGVVRFDAAKTAKILTTNGEMQDERGLAVDTTAPPPSNGGGGTPDKSISATFSAKKSQKLKKQIVIDVSCPQEACTAAASGSLNVPKVSASKRYKLKKVSKALKAGEKGKLRLKLSKKVRGAAKRALRKGKKPRAKLTVTATDAAGNVTTQALRIRLKK